MEALKNLVGNVPDWLKRLDDLNGQIEQRQVELAELRGSRSPPKSLKNKGSTESLKPRDEPAAYPEDPPPPSDSRQAPRTTSAPALQTEFPATDAPDPALAAGNGEADPSSPANSNTLSSQQRQLTSQVRAAGQARARALLRKRQRTDSVISAEGAAPKYRTRSMIIVYYDSYVQSFFEELVKFVSASRNMMRKAKMAARVAHIKRMAELEMPDSDEEDDGLPEDGGPIPVDSSLQPEANGTNGATAPTLALVADTPLEVAAQTSQDDESSLPPLRYVSTRRMQPMARSPDMLVAGNGRPPFSRITRGPSRSIAGGFTDQPPDIYDELDKGLEYVQSMCEHAAHQFLRDGDCSDEVANIRRRLQETKEVSDKEMERVIREDPAALEALSEETGKVRSYRPQSMRRDPVSAKENLTDIEITGGGSLEVDEGVDDMDQEMTAPPKLMYRSTRVMR